MVEGGDEAIMTVLAEQSETLMISEKEGRIDIRAADDLRLLLPADLPLMVESVSGDTFITGMNGRVLIGKVSGDLVLQHLAGASIDSVGGDLSIRDITEGVEGVRVGGDLIVDGVGSVSSSAVYGDAWLKGVAGSVNLSVSGDVEVTVLTPEIPGIVISAGGDSLLILPDESRALLQLISGGEIEIDVAGQQGEWCEGVNLPLGDGGNIVKVNAGGDISVISSNANKEGLKGKSDQPFEDLENLGTSLEKQIREYIIAMTGGLHWATQGAVNAGEKARQKVEKSIRRMEKEASSFETEAYQKKRYAHEGNQQGRVDYDGDHVGSETVVGFTYPGALDNETRTGSLVSDEERVIVLKMLQEKKISVEEAEKLLTALEK